MAIIQDYTFDVLHEVAPEIEIARAPGGHWFGRFSMQPLSITDSEVEDMRCVGLLHVVEWDDGPERCREVVDIAQGALRRVRTWSRALVVRLSTDGWALLGR